MNIPTILAIAVVASVVANFLHWRSRRDGRFLYYPQPGWIRFVFAVWTVSIIAAAVLFLAGFVSAPAFVAVTLSLTIAHEVYSIARRQYERVGA